MKMPVALMLVGMASASRGMNSTEKALRPLAGLAETSAVITETSHHVGQDDDSSDRLSVSDGTSNSAKAGVHVHKSGGAKTDRQRASEAVAGAGFLDIFLKNETGGLLGGLAMTTGGTIWGFNKLAEALDDFKEYNEVDPIGGGYGFCISVLLILGPMLLAHTVFNKFAPNQNRSYVAGLVLTGLAGFSFAGGICFSSAFNGAGMGVCYGLAALFLIAVVFTFVKGHKAENGLGNAMDLTVVANHAVGFASLIGGFALLSFGMTEELADAHVDSLKGEAAGVWALFTIAFFWLMKAFMTPNGGRDGNGYMASLKDLGNWKLLLAAGATAGLLAGGFELSIIGNLGCIPCFGIAALAIVFVVLSRFMSQLKFLADFLGIKQADAQ